MSRLEREILNFMGYDARFQLSRFKDFISDRFDAELDEVEDSLNNLEASGDIFRPREDLVKRLEA